MRLFPIPKPLVATVTCTCSRILTPPFVCGVCQVRHAVTITTEKLEPKEQEVAA